MYLVGSCDELGAWDLSRKAVRFFFFRVRCGGSNVSYLRSGEVV